MDEISKAFGKAMKLKRVEKDLSQEDLANQSGLARSFVSGIERGETQPTLSSLWKIAETLGCSPSELLSKAEDILSAKQNLL